MKDFNDKELEFIERFNIESSKEEFEESEKINSRFFDIFDKFIIIILFFLYISPIVLILLLFLSMSHYESLIGSETINILDAIFKNDSIAKSDPAAETLDTFVSIYNQRFKISAVILTIFWIPAALVTLTRAFYLMNRKNNG